MRNELPTGWKKRTLRSLNQGGVTSINPADFPDDIFEYYSIPAYQDGANPVQVCGREILSQKLDIPKNCLLFGKLNPRVEKVWNVNCHSIYRCLASTEWLPIVPTDDLDQSFGYFLLWSDWVLPLAKELVSGSTPSRQRVEPRSFYAIEVSLPPISEQRFIAQILTQVQSVVLAQDSLIASAQDLKRAAMQKLFTRGLRGEPKKETGIQNSWKMRRFADIANYKAGRTPARSNSAYWQDSSENIPWVTISDMTEFGIVTETKESITCTAFDQVFHGQIVPSWTLLMSFKLTIGRVATLGIEACHNEAIISIFPKPGIDQRYLGYFLAQVDYNTLQDRQVKGNTLNREKIDRIEVWVPPLDEQREIATILGTIDRKIDLHRRKRVVLNELFKTLLHKLMTGEIRVADLDVSTSAAIPTHLTETQTKSTYEVQA